METNRMAYLLSIFGQLKAKTLEAARSVHNETAGAAPNVAAARSLGDLSHMVYVPLDHPGPEAGDFLILDIWNSLEGLNQFFANPHVQAGGDQIFSQREPLVWQAAEGFVSYHLPAPHDKPDRLVGVVRGRVRSRAEAQAVHNALAGNAVSQARAAGNLSHEAYFRLAPPGAPEALEFFAVDVWMDGKGMQGYYGNKEFAKGLMQMFAAEPSATLWAHPAGGWVEW
jgi:quinol monooxygenase YgiN